MEMKRIIWILLVALPLFAASQEQVNQTDASGLRQGLWKKQYTNGKTIYEGRFVDNKPTGNWKRYHDNGKIQAEIAYFEKSDSAFTTLFDLAGNRMAEGIFLNQKKVGEWKYFSEGRLVSEDSFSNGLKKGLSKKYYPSGAILETSEWENGLRNGKYFAFFENGQSYLEVNYFNDLREETCRSYFESGKVEMEAFYKSDKRHGDWKYYNESGELLYTLKYKDGVLLNPELLDSIQTTTLNRLDQNKGNIPDPEQFIENPEEYMRRLK